MKSGHLTCTSLIQIATTAPKPTYEFISAFWLAGRTGDKRAANMQISFEPVTVANTTINVPVMSNTKNRGRGAALLAPAARVHCEVAHHSTFGCTIAEETAQAIGLLLRRL